MLSLKTNTEMLTNFVVPVYQSFLNETYNIQESKKNTVDVLANTILKYVTAEKEVDIYTLIPILQLLEQIIAFRIKELITNKDGNKNAIDFHKDLLYKIHQFHDICLKMKKE